MENTNVDYLKSTDNQELESSLSPRSVIIESLDISIDKNELAPLITDTDLCNASDSDKLTYVGNIEERGSEIDDKI